MAAQAGLVPPNSTHPVLVVAGLLVQIEPVQTATCPVALPWARAWLVQLGTAPPTRNWLDPVARLVHAVPAQ